MKTTILLAALCGLVLGVGCSSMTIKYDYDRHVVFKEYKTFDWLDNRPGIGGRVVAAADEFIHERIRHAVVGELTAKGLKEDPTDPDILLFYHVGVEDRIDVSAYGYRYGKTYWGWHGKGIDVYTYREGTLVIDLVDPDTMLLVWRGAAQGTIEEDPIPGTVKPKIDGAVTKILADYPPAQ